jgi:hypothetical protein
VLRAGKHAARACGDTANHATLARRVPALENNDDPCTLFLHPGQETRQLDLEPAQLPLEIFASHFPATRPRVDCLAHFPIFDILSPIGIDVFAASKL